MLGHKSSSITLGSLAALGCEALYGLSYIFTKQATNVASPNTVLYQGIGNSVLALFLSNFAIANIGVSTVVSIVAGVLWLGEAFSGLQLLGAAIIIIGVYTANGTFHRKKS